MCPGPIAQTRQRPSPGPKTRHHTPNTETEDLTKQPSPRDDVQKQLHLHGFLVGTPKHLKRSPSFLNPPLPQVIVNQAPSPKTEAPTNPPNPPNPPPLPSPRKQHPKHPKHPKHHKHPKHPKPPNAPKALKSQKPPQTQTCSKSPASAAQACASGLKIWIQGFGFQGLGFGDSGLRDSNLGIQGLGCSGG